MVFTLSGGVLSPGGTPDHPHARFAIETYGPYGFGDPPFSAPICEPLSQLCESNVGASTHGIGDKNPGEMGMSQSATNRGGPSPDRNKANNQVNQWDLLRISMLQSTVYMWH